METPDKYAAFEARMNNEGWMLFPGVVGAEMMERLKRDVESVYAVQRKIQARNGVDFPGVAQHLIKSLWRGGSFADYLEHLPLKDYADAYFATTPYILNTLSCILNMPGQDKSYERRQHRDMRTYFPVRLSLNMLLMLDDFTEDNGATLLYSGSHLKPQMPDDEDFAANATKMIGKAGSIVVFDSNVVHGAGQNVSDKVRRSFVYTLVRPFMKQQCQYHTLITDSDSDWMKQLLGYNARTPNDLNEWFQPLERRMYKTGQG